MDSQNNNNYNNNEDEGHMKRSATSDSIIVTADVGTSSVASIASVGSVASLGSMGQRREVVVVNTGFVAQMIQQFSASRSGSPYNRSGSERGSRRDPTPRVEQKPNTVLDVEDYEDMDARRPDRVYESVLLEVPPYTFELKRWRTRPRRYYEFTGMFLVDFSLVSSRHRCSDATFTWCQRLLFNHYWTVTTILLQVRKTCHEPLLAHATMLDGNRVHLSTTNEVMV